MTSSISRGYGKCATRVPGCSFVWTLRVVYFPLKHSCLYNKWLFTIFVIRLSSHQKIQSTLLSKFLFCCTKAVVSIFWLKHKQTTCKKPNFTPALSRSTTGQQKAINAWKIQVCDSWWNQLLQARRRLLFELKIRSFRLEIKWTWKLLPENNFEEVDLFCRLEKSVGKSGHFDWKSNGTETYFTKTTWER